MPPTSPQVSRGTLRFVPACSPCGSPRRCTSTRPNGARSIIGAPAPHRLQRRHFTARLCLRGRDRVRQDLAVTDLGSHSELGAVLRPRLYRVFADLPPDQLKQAVQQGLAEAIQAQRPSCGHCEVVQRIGAASASTRDRESRPALRALGRAGLPRGLKGIDVRLPVRLVTLAQDIIALNEATASRR